MSDGAPAEMGWFAVPLAGTDADLENATGEIADSDDAIVAIRDGAADGPDDWPAIAVETGVADSVDDYYDQLRTATIEAARATVHERERAGDQQLIHGVRAMDDCERTANEIAERVAEWAGSLYDDAGTGVEYARDVAAIDPEGPAEARLIGLAERCVDLADEAAALRTEIERTAPEVAPNLSALGGPILTARLLALAGGLESLAKSPSSTVQVLGAEDALFAHLRGEGPSPKHGVIFTHEYVRGTHPEHRGSAARALAGKLTIAARVDHYSGERKPELDEQLDTRMRRIRARTGDGIGDTDGDVGTQERSDDDTTSSDSSGDSNGDFSDGDSDGDSSDGDFA